MKEALYARVEAFLEEFPFLERYVVKVERFSERPTVQRVDLDLMDRYGWTDVWTRRNRYGEMGSVRFLLIGNDGQELGEAKPHNVVRSKFSLWRPSTWFREDVSGETVYEAIQKLDDPNRVHYVLEINDMWDRRPDFDPDYGLKVTLHKVPSGRSLSDWLAQIQEIAKGELRGELTKVNEV